MIYVLDTYYVCSTTDKVHIHNNQTITGSANITTGEERGSTKEFCPLNLKSIKLESLKSRIYCISKSEFRSLEICIENPDL
jgi:hypothetical protein